MSAVINDALLNILTSSGLHSDKQTLIKFVQTQSTGAAEYADCISAEELDPAQINVQKITLNNHMVRLKFLITCIALRSTLTQSGST